MPQPIGKYLSKWIGACFSPPHFVKKRQQFKLHTHFCIFGKIYCRSLAILETFRYIGLHSLTKLHQWVTNPPFDSASSLIRNL